MQNATCTMEHEFFPHPWPLPCQFWSVLMMVFGGGKIPLNAAISTDRTLLRSYRNYTSINNFLTTRV